MDYTIYKIKNEITDLVIKALERDIDRQQVEITLPPDPTMGDLSVPCFYFTKLLRISPNQIAAELKNKIHPSGHIKSIQNIGPYLNFFIDQKYLAQKVLKEVYKKGDKYGQLKLPKEKIMIEYSGPNTP